MLPTRAAAGAVHLRRDAGKGAVIERAVDATHRSLTAGKGERAAL